MRTSFLQPPLLLGILLHFPAVTFSMQAYHFVLEKEGIILYEHDLGNDEQKSYLAVFSVPAGIKSCAGILYHEGFHPLFMDGIMKSELIRQQPDEKSLYFYHVIDLPWPLPNRDMVTLALFEASDDYQKVIVKMRSVPEEKEATLMTRVNVPEREWHFQRVGPNQTQVSYYYKSDQEKIPLFLQDLISIDGPLKMMVRFRKLAVENNRPLARMTWLKE